MKTGRRARLGDDEDDEDWKKKQLQMEAQQKIETGGCGMQSVSRRYLMEKKQDPDQWTKTIYSIFKHIVFAAVYLYY